MISVIGLSENVLFGRSRMLFNFCCWGMYNNFNRCHANMLKYTYSTDHGEVNSIMLIFDWQIFENTHSV